MIAIKPGMNIEIHDYGGLPFTGVIISIDKKEKYDGEILISAYCTVRFDNDKIYSDMYIIQNDIVKSTEGENKYEHSNIQ